MVFADPPYFLSNDGLSIQSGEIVSVNKGDWDKLKGSIHDFNYNWISAARKALKPSGTIWVCGSMHNIFSVYEVLIELGFKVLNVITWQKRNPPPNFSCRFFTHSTEFVIWARREQKVGHYYNYELMKEMNGGKQMKDVWNLSSIAPWEKKFGKHPTQKPLSLLSRIVLASTQKGDLVIDPFTGSSTTGVASVLFDRKYIGIDTDSQYLDVSIKRYNEAKLSKQEIISKIQGLSL
jgi:site-specific DNA-methyltransferase (adenine-specific)